MEGHGEIFYSWEDNIFILSSEGAFNTESIDYYTPLIQESVSNRKVSSWKRLEVWDAEVLASPETIEKCKLIWNWYEANGCVLTAIVLSNLLQTHVVHDIFHSHAKVFSDKDKALEWLRSN